MYKKYMKEDRPKRTCASGSSSNCSGLDPLTNHPSISNVTNINNQVELPPYQSRRNTNWQTHQIPTIKTEYRQFRLHWVLVSSPLLGVMISWLLLSTWMTRVPVLRAHSPPCFPWMQWMPQDRWIQRQRRRSSAPAGRRAPCFAATHILSSENFAATIANPVQQIVFFGGGCVDQKRSWVA